MLLVGLTGGIGSGKSTVADALVDKGAVLVDGDQIARQIVAPGGEAYQPVVERFGTGILAADASIDRPALAALVFNDAAALRDLNALTHPAIARLMLDAVAAQVDTDRIVVLDIPLLKAQTISFYGLQAVVVVDTPEDLAITRLVTHRGFTEADARARVAAQISRDERRQLAGFVIDNTGDRDALQVQVDQAWAWLEGLRAST
ncbi:MAG: dephospho-CoA kinase [Actinomycetota bacterium]|nr:dephospho-CoA kinase [Actinomycetota bacterium]